MKYLRLRICAIWALFVLGASNAGAQWQAPDTISPPGISVRPGVQLAVGGAGQVAVSWTARTTLASASDAQVVVRAPDGAFGPVQTLAQTAGEFDDGTMAGFDAGGNAVVTWFNTSLEPVEHVYAVFAPVGFPFVSPPQAVSGPSDNETDPQLVVLANGDAVVVWSSRDASGEPVRAAVRRVTGAFESAAFGAPQVIGARNAMFPRSATDAAGNVFAVWRHASDAGALEYARRDVQSGVWSPTADQGVTVPGQVIYRRNTGVFGQGRHALAAAANGAAVVVVPDRLAASDPVQLVAVRFDPASGWSPAVPTEPSTPFAPLVVPDSANVSPDHATAKPPALAMDGGGNAVVAWTERNGDAYGVKVASLSAGGVFAGPEDLGAAGSAATDLPAVAVNAAGDTVVAWAAPDTNGTKRIMAATRPAGESKFCRAVFVSAPGQDATAPVVGMDASGVVFAAWNRFDGTSTLCCRRVEFSTNLVGCPPLPQSLPSSDSAKRAVECQKRIDKTAAQLLDRQLDRLTDCGSDLADCLQKKPSGEKRDTCLAKARKRCSDAKAKLDAAQARSSDKIADRCGDLDTSELLGPAGLGFESIAESCGAAAASVDARALGACLADRQRCRGDAVYALEDARLAALAATYGVTSPATSCLDDYGGGGSLEDPKGSGKAVRACGSAVAKAAQAFVLRKVKALQKCAEKAFDCLQRRVGDGECLVKARHTCDRELADVDELAAALAPSLAAKCDPLPFATLAAPEALNLAALTDECGRFGVASLASVTDYGTCLVRQHACLAEEIFALETPRFDQLVDLLVRNLTSAFCPGPSPGASLRRAAQSNP